MVDYAWIPTRLISMGKTLKINGADGWTIIDIFEPEISQEELRERERDYIYQRVASDI